MWFWWYIFISDLLVPVIMVLGGWFMEKHCPGKINSLLGYRTRRSMTNHDTWEFAHRHCGKLWKRVGLILLVATILTHLPFYGSGEDAIGTLSLVVLGIQLAVLTVSIFPTESALKKTFREDGSRK